MQFSSFAQHLSKLESLSSRLEMTSILAELYKELKGEEIEVASYLLQGQLRPAYEAVEFQFSVKLMIRALAQFKHQQNGATNHDSNSSEAANLFGEVDYSSQEDMITKLYKKMGDLGLATEELLGNYQPSHQASLVKTYHDLLALAQDTGEGSQQRKVDHFIALIKQTDALSAKFLVRIMLGNLRLGFSTMTLIDALSWAAIGSKNDRSLLEDTYQKKADIGKLAFAYLSATAEQRQQVLEAYELEVGVPVVPALCQRLNTAQEIVDKMGEVLVEPKYDGLRVQIHVDKKHNLLRTFTRNLEETSSMFPELKTAINDLRCDECILDAEAIGYDPTTGNLLPFQDTITRKRKHDIETIAESIPVRFYIFDVLSFNGETLLSKPLIERKAVLAKIFDQTQTLYHSAFVQTNNADEVHQWHNKYLSQKLEGAVIKQVNSSYQSGRKGWSWVKIKEEEGTRGKLADTIDAVVMGYYFGRGKRTDFGIGAFLVGVLDEQQQVKTLAKIGTGLSDEQFKEFKQRCEPLVTDKQPENFLVDKALTPDVWVKPDLVVEVAADELTKSPNHTAGVALRFPRLIRFRDDKNWDGATTVAELSSLQ